MEEPRSEVPQEIRSAIEASGSQPALPQTPAVPREWGDILGEYNSMLSKIRSWGQALLLLGVVQVIASGVLSTAWGVLLLLVGAASFYFKDAAMFMVYALTILWAGISNLFGGGWIWIGYGLLQFFWAFGLLREFWRFRHVEDGYLASLQGDWSKGVAPPMRARRLFPWLSFALGLLMIAGVVVAFVLLATTSSSGIQPGDPLYVLFDVLPNLAVLGMATGLASLLCRFPLKLLSAIGVLACGLVLVGWVALLLL